jgi:anthranilate synthase/aminodeoxychorismate synthase-like glutamine amidotransferase
VKVLVCDNDDSFTYNLVSCIGALGADVDVVRSGRITVADIAERAPDGVVISPGPGDPSGAGISVALARWCAASATPLLGVCLGLQAIVEAFGGRTVRAPQVRHGKTSPISHDGSGIFRDLPTPLEAMRYHSLVADRPSMPRDLRVTAWTDGLVMGVAHRTLPIYGVQFHPESVLTPDGPRLIANFVYELEPMKIVTVSPRETVVPGSGS